MGEIELDGEYGEWSIEYNPVNDCFRARHKDGRSVEGKTPGEIKKKIKIIEKKGFIRVPAYRFGYSGIIEVEITSNTEDLDFDDIPYYWIVNKDDKTRNKKSGRDLIADTKENRNLISEWRQLDKTRETIEENMKSLREKMERVGVIK